MIQYLLRRDAVKGTTSVAVASIVGQMATGGALVLVARRSSPAPFGEFASFYAVSLGLGAFLDFGSSQRMTRDLARRAVTIGFRPWLLRRSLLQLPVGIVALVIGAHFAGPETSGAALGLGLQALTFPMAQGVGAAVRVFRSPAFAAWSMSAGNLLTLSVAFAAPRYLSLTATASAAAASWVVTAAIGLYATRNSPLGVWTTSTEHTSANPWESSASFGTANLAYMSDYLTVPTITAAAGAAEAGLAAAVSRWAAPIEVLPTSLSQQIFPRLAAIPDSRTALQQLRGISYVAAPCAAAIVGLIAFGPQIVTLLLGSDFQGSASVLRWYAVATIPVIATPALSAFLQARGAERTVAKFSLTLGLLRTVGLYFLASHMGASAAPFTLLLFRVALLTIFITALRNLLVDSDVRHL